MPTKVTWRGKEYLAKVREAASAGMDAAAEVVRMQAMKNLSKPGKFKNFARQASRKDKAFVGKFGFVDPPGGFPRALTGRLMRSIVRDAPSLLTRRIGPDNTVRYGRIHELGGHTGKSYIPARPYLRPALATSLGRASAAFRGVVRAKMRGVRLPGMEGKPR